MNWLRRLKGLKDVLIKSTRGGIIVAAGAFLGGLVAGPIGMGVGGILCGMIASRTLSFRSASDVFRNDFEPSERGALLARFGGFLFESALSATVFVIGVWNNAPEIRSCIDFKNFVLHPLANEVAPIIRKELARFLMVCV